MCYHVCFDHTPVWFVVLHSVTYTVDGGESERGGNLLTEAMLVASCTCGVVCGNAALLQTHVFLSHNNIDMEGIGKLASQLKVCLHATLCLCGIDGGVLLPRCVWDMC